VRLLVRSTDRKGRAGVWAHSVGVAEYGLYLYGRFVGLPLDFRDKAGCLRIWGCGMKCSVLIFTEHIRSSFAAGSEESSALLLPLVFLNTTLVVGHVRLKTVVPSGHIQRISSKSDTDN
jgi:hypothetical protein